MQSERRYPAVMILAAGYGRLALVKLLLERGAALKAVNGKQQKPADVAALNGEVRRSCWS
jgi:ankyrin repeat protein